MWLIVVPSPEKNRAYFVTRIAEYSPVLVIHTDSVAVPFTLLFPVHSWVTFSDSRLNNSNDEISIMTPVSYLG